VGGAAVSPHEFEMSGVCSEVELLDRCVPTHGTFGEDEGRGVSAEEGGAVAVGVQGEKRRRRSLEGDRC
jgi:hypothetical protein